MSLLGKDAEGGRGRTGSYTLLCPSWPACLTRRKRRIIDTVTVGQSIFPPPAEQAMRRAAVRAEFITTTKSHFSGLQRIAGAWAIAWFAVLSVTEAAAQWQPAKIPLMTRWGRAVTPDSVLPEYPRPQMVRQAWLNLNGLWDYAITRKEGTVPGDYQGKILVPFPIEAALSGVHKTLDYNNRLWYRRHFDVPKTWAGQRVMLNFGAVDWEATVLVNGRQVGTHRGGYDAFSFDITDALTARGPQELIVAVLDATGDGQAKGKQTGGGLQALGTLGYTAASGIWQTVWIEPVPRTGIARLKITPEVNRGVVRLTAIVCQAGARPAPLPSRP